VKLQGEPQANIKVLEWPSLEQKQMAIIFGVQRVSPRK